MSNSQRLATVRARLLQWLNESKNAATDPAATPEKIISESILIRDDFYIGRRFRTDHHRAVWFIENDELKIHDRDGNWLATLTAFDIDRLPRAHETIRLIPPSQTAADQDLRRAA